MLTLLEDLAARGMEILFTSDREQSLTSVIGTTIDTLESCAMSKAIATFLSLKKQVTNLATNIRTAMRSDARLSEAPLWDSGSVLHQHQFADLGRGKETLGRHHDTYRGGPIDVNDIHCIRRVYHDVQCSFHTTKDA